WTAWIDFRDWNGALVYFSHLVTYRCAIKEVRYGYDGGPGRSGLQAAAVQHSRPQQRPGRHQDRHEDPAQDKVDAGATHLSRRPPIPSAQLQRSEISQLFPVDFVDWDAMSAKDLPKPPRA